MVQKKTSEKDGYDAVQIGLVEKVSNRRVTSAHARTLREGRRAAGADARRSAVQRRRERRRPGAGRHLQAGDSIDVVGQSKGKGFQGVVKRHGFGGGRETHGSMFHRAPGSIGASAFPSRVMKGMRMGGRMGGDQVTVKNLRVAKVDAENNLLYIRGAVPGGRNGLVFVRFSKNGKRGE